MEKTICRCGTYASRYGFEEKKKTSCPAIIEQEAF